eukprot:SAG11_NODE_18056_length_501_cov_0.893035_1_plen_91_part_01
MYQARSLPGAGSNISLRDVLPSAEHGVPEPEPEDPVHSVLQDWPANLKAFLRKKRGRKSALASLSVRKAPKLVPWKQDEYSNPCQSRFDPP